MPRPLAVILAVAAVQAVAWALVLPAFQGQDESSHVVYAQRIAEKGSLSWTALGEIPGRQRFSSEVYAAEQYSGTGSLALNVAMRPYFAGVDEERWERASRELGDADRRDMTSTTAMRNPPLYYLGAAAVYTPLQGSDFFTRLTVMRLATIPLFLVAVFFAWLLAGEVFGRRRWLQAVVALTVALHPMLAQLGGIVNPDVLIAAVYAIGLWLAAVIVNRGASVPRLLGAVGVSLAAGLTHARAIPLVFVLLAAVLVRVWPVVRRRGRASVAAVSAGLGLAVIAFGAATVWLALRGDVTGDRLRQFGSYLWQFYLPRPGFLDPAPGPEYGVREVVVDRLWSGFALLDVNLAPGVLDAVAVATVAGILAVIAALVVQRVALRRQAGLAVVFGVAIVSLVWILHVAAWRDLQEFGDPIITGRYLTPLLPLAGLGLASIALVLPRRFGPGAVTLVLGLEALLALSALGTALVRFHV